MNSRLDLGVDQNTLEAWQPPQPDESFAKDVLQEYVEGSLVKQRKPSRTHFRRVGWAIASVLALTCGMYIALRPQSEQGEIVTQARESLALGERVVAVAERNAFLRWTVRDGHGEVVQERGNVFYRVEKETEWIVRTPQGDVHVRGTCFRVEVEMNPRWTHAAVGAAVGASVVVSVYEGRVALADQHEEKEVILAAGERGTFDREGFPLQEDADHQESPWMQHQAQEPVSASSIGNQRSSSGGDSSDQHVILQQQLQRQADEIARLQTELALAGDAHLPMHERRYYPATQAELVALADRCTIRLDLPPVMGMTPGDVSDNDRATKMGLRPSERPTVDDALIRLHQNAREDFETLYVEATGDTDGVDELSPEAMFAEIRDKALPEDRQNVVGILALERAGLRTPRPIAERSIVERAFRRLTALGDDLQHLLAESLGPERAHEIRAAAGGWQWGRSEYGGCGNK